MTSKTALIIGAGPAGLAAAYELLEKSDIKIIIIEEDSQVGGLSKTITTNTFSTDIGPHRFFSKSERVNKFWHKLLNEENFLKVNRVTRIFYLKKFFSYPISVSTTTLTNLGFIKTVKILFSYIRTKIFKRAENSLEDFYINRFGRELYNTFFREYTEKVWGVSCQNIPKDWGAQRINNLSISKALKSFFLNYFFQKSTEEKSLINEFYYPKKGAGQMYEKIAEKIIASGGIIKLDSRAENFNFENGEISSVEIRNLITGDIETIRADYFLSTMPIKNLVSGFKIDVPAEIYDIAKGLIYRDYIIVSLLFNKNNLNGNEALKDNWIYVQESNIKMGRLDLFHNFSSEMTRNNNMACLGAEYYCQEKDELWRSSDLELRTLAENELQEMELVNKSASLDFKVLRIKKAYPAYFGTYQNFDILKNYLDKINNLYLIGRNGMHRYNNMDHSILSGFTAADNIINNITNKENIWQVNADDEYHEK
ncbi:MAG: FAD-dependent oxidoreductase [Candidatus Falkowbacteria bacterium]